MKNKLKPGETWRLWVRSLSGLLCLLATIVYCAKGALAANLTQGTETAREFGVHEIMLTGNGSVRNPFDTPATVTFTDPKGEKVQVDAFYDGGNTWRARLYVERPGHWLWQSNSSADRGLNAKSGSFEAQETTDLRGMLREHPDNPKHWATDDGRWFINIDDTAYRFFNKDAKQWKAFTTDLIAKGATSLRAGAFGGCNWDGDYQGNYPWAGSYSRFDLSKFQTTDTRLTWLLDNHPDVYVQMILFGLKKYRSDATGQAWAAIPRTERTKLLKYMVARWAAFPQIFWLIVNDVHYGNAFPKNNAMAEEVGQYFLKNDPWQHPLSTGPARGLTFPFRKAPWASYYHIETRYALPANQSSQYKSDNVPVFMGEDEYEANNHGPTHPGYFYRWMIWSWLLSGGSVAYGGPGAHRDAMIPYSQVNPRLVGLNSVPYLRRFLEDHHLELADFEADDSKVSDLDGRVNNRRPKLMLKTKSGAAYLIYHPNAQSDGQGAQVNSGLTPRMRVDLTQTSGTFTVEWLRARDGVLVNQGTVQGGQSVQFTAPWKGEDVVLYLKATA